MLSLSGYRKAVYILANKEEFSTYLVYRDLSTFKIEHPSRPMSQTNKNSIDLHEQKILFILSWVIYCERTQPVESRNGNQYLQTFNQLSMKYYFRRSAT